MENLKKINWPILKNFFKIKVKDKQRLSTRDRIKRTALNRLAKLSPNDKKSTEKFSFIIREFFEDFFKLNYEFTYDELQKEIKKVRIKQSTRQDLVSFIEDLQAARFDGQSINKPDLKNLVERMKNLLNEL